MIDKNKIKSIYILLFKKKKINTYQEYSVELPIN